MRFHVRLIGVYRELRRRKVFRVGSLYLVTAWGASLGAAELFPAFGLPDASVRIFVSVAILGLPVATLPSRLLLNGRDRVRGPIRER